VWWVRVRGDEGEYLFIRVTLIHPHPQERLTHTPVLILNFEVNSTFRAEIFHV
jgi:hypothetical protein